MPIDNNICGDKGSGTQLNFVAPNFFTTLITAAPLATRLYRGTDCGYWVTLWRDLLLLHMASRIKTFDGKSFDWAEMFYVGRDGR